MMVFELKKKKKKPSQSLQTVSPKIPRCAGKDARPTVGEPAATPPSATWGRAHPSAPPRSGRGHEVLVYSSFKTFNMVCTLRSISQFVRKKVKRKKTTIERKSKAAVACFKKIS